MIIAQDVKSGYGQKIKKPHTSVLPYLRAQEEKRKMAEKEKMVTGNEIFPPKNLKTETEKATDKNEVSGLNQYDEARLEILRG